MEKKTEVNRKVSWSRIRKYPEVNQGQYLLRVRVCVWKLKVSCGCRSVGLLSVASLLATCLIHHISCCGTVMQYWLYVLHPSYFQIYSCALCFQLPTSCCFKWKTKFRKRLWHSSFETGRYVALCLYTLLLGYSDGRYMSLKNK